MLRFIHALSQYPQFEAFNATDALPVTFDTTSGRPSDIRFQGFRTKTLSIWNTRSQLGFVSRRKCDADLFTLRFTRSGHLLRREGRGEYVGTSSQAMFVAFEAMRGESTVGGFDALSATVTREALEAARRRLGVKTVSELEDFLPLADVATASIVGLDATLQAVHLHVRAEHADDDLSVPLLEELLLYQFLTSWPVRRVSSDFRPILTSKRRIADAIDFIEANLTRPLVVADIAQACGLGMRTFQASFKREIGCSPMRFVINRRFENAHRDLTMADDRMETVSTIAFRWGFAHMGEFGRQYRRRYGCTPVETLRQRV